jgi:TonB family protein
MNRDNLKERGISFFGSILFHLVLLILLINLVPPVRVSLFRHAAEVRIVDLKTISMPQIIGLSEAQTSDALVPQTSTEALSVQGTENLAQTAPDPGVVYLKNLTIGRSVGSKEQSFDLVPNPKAPRDFSLGIGRKNSEYERKSEEETREELDFSKFQGQSLSSLPFNRIITKKRGEDLSEQINPYVSVLQEGVDLSPWVRQVVDKIRNNWNPPPIVESTALGEVKILVIIGKNGSLLSAEIVEPSVFPVFDQTATAAIRSSVPFPPLPIEFPSERLEAFLVFEFHE